MFCGVRQVFLSVARFLFRLTFSLVFNRATDVSYGRRGRQFPAFVLAAVPPTIHAFDWLFDTGAQEIFLLPLNQKGKRKG